MVVIELSLTIVIWGAGLLARLMNRWAWIVWLGGGFLAYVAVEMIFEDKAIVGWLGATGHQLKMPVSVTVGVIVTALGWGLARPEDI